LTTDGAFPGFDALFSLSDPLANRPYRGQVTWHDETVALSRAECEPQGSLPVEWSMGSGTPGNVIWTVNAHPVFVHARVLELFEANGFTGWTSYPAEVVSKSGVAIPDYFLLGIIGRCGPVDLSRSRIVLLEYPGGWIPHFRGRYFDPDTWDGSDLFMHAPDSLGKVMLHRFVTDPVRRALRRAKIYNLDFERPTDSYVPTNNYTIGLRHLLPDNFEARVAATYAKGGVPRPPWV
jgi:hypothetical protein